jgi:hypothetical protein
MRDTKDMRSALQHRNQVKSAIQENLRDAAYHGMPLKPYLVRWCLRNGSFFIGRTERHSTRAGALVAMGRRFPHGVVGAKLWRIEADVPELVAERNLGQRTFVLDDSAPPRRAK